MNIENQLIYGGSILGSKLNINKSLDILNFLYSNGVKEYDISDFYGLGNCLNIISIFENESKKDLKLNLKLGLQPICNNFLIDIIVKKIDKNFLSLFFKNKIFEQRYNYNLEYLESKVQSFVKSLRYNKINSLILHNASKKLISKDHIYLLQKLKKSGIINKFGISISDDEIDNFENNFLEIFDIIQLKFSENNLIKYYDNSEIQYYSIISSFKNLKNEQNNFDLYFNNIINKINNTNKKLIFTSRRKSHIRNLLYR